MLRRAPPVVLWAGGVSASTGVASENVSPVKKGFKRIALGIPSPALSASLFADQQSTPPLRDEGPRLQYKSPSKLEHLGERVRRFRPEWRPVPLQEQMQLKHEQKMRKLDLTSMGDWEERREVQRQQRPQRRHKKQRMKVTAASGSSCEADETGHARRRPPRHSRRAAAAAAAVVAVHSK
jgi:hypothetical protein